LALFLRQMRQTTAMKNLLILPVLLVALSASVVAQQQKLQLTVTHSDTSITDQKKKPLIEIHLGNEKLLLSPLARLDQIDQEAIKSITVLKGQSATALYGNAAKNGLIQIWLKDNPETRAYFNVEKGRRSHLLEVDPVLGNASEPQSITNQSEAKVQVRSHIENPAMEDVAFLVRYGNESYLLTSNDNIDSIGPENIQTIEVIKQKQVLEIYDLENKKGLIIIKLKKGKDSKNIFKALKGNN